MHSCPWNPIKCTTINQRLRWRFEFKPNFAVFLWSAFWRSKELQRLMSMCHNRMWATMVVWGITLEEFVHLQSVFVSDKMYCLSLLFKGFHLSHGATKSSQLENHFDINGNSSLDVPVAVIRHQSAVLTIKPHPLRLTNQQHMHLNSPAPNPRGQSNWRFMKASALGSCCTCITNPNCL